MSGSAPPPTDAGRAVDSDAVAALSLLGSAAPQQLTAQTTAQAQSSSAGARPSVADLAAHAAQAAQAATPPYGAYGAFAPYASSYPAAPTAFAAPSALPAGYPSPPYAYPPYASSSFMPPPQHLHHAVAMQQQPPQAAATAASVPFAFNPAQLAYGMPPMPYPQAAPLSPWHVGPTPYPPALPVPDYMHPGMLPAGVDPFYGTPFPHPLMPLHQQAWLTAVAMANPLLRLGGNSSCHQCKTTKDDMLLLFCTNNADSPSDPAPPPASYVRKKCRKKYCDSCLRRCYNQSVQSVNRAQLDSWICPSCENRCSCASCLRRNPALKEKLARAMSAATDSDDDASGSGGGGKPSGGGSGAGGGGSDMSTVNTTQASVCLTHHHLMQHDAMHAHGGPLLLMDGSDEKSKLKDDAQMTAAWCQHEVPPPQSSRPGHLSVDPDALSSFPAAMADGSSVSPRHADRSPRLSTHALRPAQLTLFRTTDASTPTSLHATPHSVGSLSSEHSFSRPSSYVSESSISAFAHAEAPLQPSSGVSSAASSTGSSPALHAREMFSLGRSGSHGRSVSTLIASSSEPASAQEAVRHDRSRMPAHKRAVFDRFCMAEMEARRLAGEDASVNDVSSTIAGLMRDTSDADSDMDGGSERSSTGSILAAQLAAANISIDTERGQFDVLSHAADASSSTPLAPHSPLVSPHSPLASYSAAPSRRARSRSHSRRRSVSPYQRAEPVQATIDVAPLPSVDAGASLPYAISHAVGCSELSSASQAPAASPRHGRSRLPTPLANAKGRGQAKPMKRVSRAAQADKAAAAARSAAASEMAASPTSAPAPISPSTASHEQMDQLKRHLRNQQHPTPAHAQNNPFSIAHNNISGGMVAAVTPSVNVRGRSAQRPNSMQQLSAHAGAPSMMTHEVQLAQFQTQAMFNVQQQQQQQDQLPTAAQQYARLLQQSHDLQQQQQQLHQQWVSQRVPPSPDESAAAASAAGPFGFHFHSSVVASSVPSVPPAVYPPLQVPSSVESAQLQRLQTTLEIQRLQMMIQQQELNRQQLSDEFAAQQQQLQQEDMMRQEELRHNLHAAQQEGRQLTRKLAEDAYMRQQQQQRQQQHLQHDAHGDASSAPVYASGASVAPSALAHHFAPEHQAAQAVIIDQSLHAHDERDRVKQMQELQASLDHYKQQIALLEEQMHASNCQQQQLQQQLQQQQQQQQQYQQQLSLPDASSSPASFSPAADVDAPDTSQCMPTLRSSAPLSLPVFDDARCSSPLPSGSSYVSSQRESPPHVYDSTFPDDKHFGRLQADSDSWDTPHADRLAREEARAADTTSCESSPVHHAEADEPPQHVPML